MEHDELEGGLWLLAALDLLRRITSANLDTPGWSLGHLMEWRSLNLGRHWKLLLGSALLLAWCVASHLLI